MSQLKSQVGPWKLTWKSIPRGREGRAQVEVEGKGTLDVHWKVDSQGIWIRTDQGVFGFDLKSERNDSGQSVYQVSQRNSNGQWAGIAVSVGETNTQVLGKTTQVKATRVKAQMPGKIIRTRVTVGQMVEKDQPVMVMEAMKMENEIRSPLTGKVTQIKVNEGQAVETGAELLWIDPAELSS